MRIPVQGSPIYPIRPGEREPYPYQEKVLNWASDKKKVGLFLEMRLGKTLVTLRWLRGKADISRVLIVAPLTVLRSWERELEEEGLSSVLLRGPKNKREELAFDTSPGFYLINFETLRESPIIAGLEKINPKNPMSRLRYTGGPRWDCVVIDESTRIKNPRAKVTKVALKGFQETPYKAILSGLPAPESPTNYWPQMAFLGDGEWMRHRNFYDWREQHFLGADGVWFPKKGALDTIKEALRASTVALSRKAAGIGNKTIRESLTVPMHKEQHRAFILARDQFLKELQDGKELTTNWAIVKLLWMHRISGGFNAGPDEFPWTGKLDALISQLTGDLSREKVVVWAHFTAEVDAILERLKATGIKATGIHGKMGLSQDARWKRIDAFTDSDTRVLVAQPETMKYGVTLGRACDTAIYYSRSFGLETSRQSEDRIALPGKESPLLILDLVSDGSLDGTILSRLRQKDATQRGLLDALIAAVVEGNFGDYSSVSGGSGG